MELTPKFKKPKKQRTRTARIPSHVKAENLEQLQTLSDYSNFTKTQILEIIITEAFDNFTMDLDTTNPNHNRIYLTKFKPLNPKKMTAKPQTHLFTQTGEPVNEKLIFQNFSTLERSFFDNLKIAEKEIKAGGVSGYLYSEITRQQRFYANGVFTNMKQL